MVIHRCAIALILTGCSFGPEATNQDPDTSSSDDGTSSISSATFPFTTSPVDGDGSSGPEEDTGSSTGEASESSDSGGSSGSSDESTTAGSSTGGLEPTYPFCDPTDRQPCDEDDVCIWTDGNADMTTAAGFCSPTCATVEGCPPPPPESDAVPACTYYYVDLPLYCHLRCENGETCPDGTECRPMMTLPETSGWYTFVCA